MSGSNVVRVWPMRALGEWFMRKEHFDGHDAVLIDELIRAGVLEYRDPEPSQPVAEPVVGRDAPSLRLLKADASDAEPRP